MKDLEGGLDWTDWNISQSPHATGHSNIPFRSYPSDSKYVLASSLEDADLDEEILEGGNELDVGVGPLCVVLEEDGVEEGRGRDEV